MKNQLPNNPLEIKAALENLVDSLGWEILAHNLQVEVDEIQDKLNGKGGEIKDLAELKTLQDRREDRVYLRDLPANLIEQLIPNDPNETNLDPYAGSSPEKAS